MKKRYYLSMFSLFLLTLLFDAVYIPAHKSIELFLLSGAIHFVLLVPVSFIGIYRLYKPIDRMFLEEKVTVSARVRVRRLTWYSSLWIFAMGAVYFAGMIIALWFTSVETGNVEMEKIPTSLWLTAIPSTLYIFAILPAFISWFIINDFTLDLKAKLFTRFQLTYPAGRKRIGLTLLSAFIVLGLFPTILVTLELIVSAAGKQYEKFSDMTPLQGLLPDRMAIFIGMICAVVFITRSFTKPINLLLAEMNKVREGNYTTRAAVVTTDEIGELTAAFNEMVSGLAERELIRDTFGRYVTKDVATAILEKKINLKGETRLCTILVTDIKDYSTLSEQSAPAEIVQMLNEYFTSLVSIIQKHKGVVNEFIGDSVFAFFNVPLDDPDHAVNAINAALEIDQVTSGNTFGKGRRLITRIGINTGMVVAGNIGSADRLKFTVVGDEVNIAARLEQLNKKMGTRILAGENTVALAGNRSYFTALGDVQLKGKEKRIKVFDVSAIQMAR